MGRLEWVIKNKRSETEGLHMKSSLSEVKINQVFNEMIKRNHFAPHRKKWSKGFDMIGL
jgi:hypothetical protein